jgi:hypothetical protein
VLIFYIENVQAHNELSYLDVSDYQKYLYSDYIVKFNIRHRSTYTRGPLGCSLSLGASFVENIIKSFITILATRTYLVLANKIASADTP